MRRKRGLPPFDIGRSTISGYAVMFGGPARARRQWPVPPRIAFDPDFHATHDISFLAHKPRATWVTQNFFRDRSPTSRSTDMACPRMILASIITSEKTLRMPSNRRSLRLTSTSMQTHVLVLNALKS
jgi:hypothetical protein